MFLLLTILAGIVWPSQSRSQLVRLDSVIVETARSITADAGTVRVTADPELTWIVPFFPDRSGPGELHLFSVSGLISPVQRDSARLSVRVAGKYRQSDSTSVQQNREWLYSRNIALSTQDREILSARSARLAHWAEDGSAVQSTVEPESFWKSTLEPALVILGAGAIVALFFLIRS